MCCFVYNTQHKSTFNIFQFGVFKSNTITHNTYIFKTSDLLNIPFDTKCSPSIARAP